MLVKHLLNEATAAESEVVNNWINKDANNKEYYNQLKTIWDSSKKLGTTSKVDEDNAWINFQSRISRISPTQRFQRNNRFYLVKIAAAIALLFIIGLVTFFSVSKKAIAKIALLKTYDNTLTDTLTDGTIITLNKNSAINYPIGFPGKTRPVSLAGEAFFLVAHNKKKPFIIMVKNIEVTVVGTSFNINSDINYTEIIVETGNVKVTKASNTVFLSAGEKLQIPNNNSIGIKGVTDDKLYNYYRTKQFVCNGTPLWRLVKVLNKAYGANIIIGRKDLNNYSLNTTFNNVPLDKILEIIHLTFNIGVVKQNGQVILN